MHENLNLQELMNMIQGCKSFHQKAGGEIGAKRKFYPSSCHGFTYTIFSTFNAKEPKNLAAITLEKIGDTAAIGALKKLLSNPDEPGNVRIAAKEALDILTKK